MLRRRRYIIEDSSLDKGSQELLKVVLQLITQKNRLRSPKDINIKDLADVSGYSVSKARKWQMGEEVYDSASRLTYMATTLNADPILLFKVLINQVSADEALKITAQSLKKQQILVSRLLVPEIEEEPDVFVQHPHMINPIRQRLRNKVARIMQFGHRTADDYFDTVETATLFGVSQRTVQWWLDTKKLTTDRTSGGHARIRYSQILDFIQSRGAFSPFEDFINKRIIFIDTEANLAGLKKAFKNWRGYDIHYESDPNKAMEIIGTLNPEFILASADMPDLEISTLLSVLKKVKSSNLQGFIVMKNKGDRKKYLEMGANMIIHRPIKADHVKDMIIKIEAEQLANP
ncbi:MAG: hypothetical protein Kow0090_09440 [Myxococcota bacterium]